MKKQFFIALLGLSLVACNSDEFLPQATDDVEVLPMENLRTETEAIEIATKGLNEFYPVKSRSARDLSGMNVVMLQSPVSRSSEDSNPLYVVNFGNESGYAIVSAAKDREPLLAVTESGSITSLDEIDNPGLRLFVDGAMKLQKDTTALVPIPGGDGGELVDIFRNDTVFHINTEVEPRITVKWGQRNPEGMLCPNGICGCVATAGAQALSYFEYPETLNLTFPERKSDIISLDWENMKRMVTPSYYLGKYELQLASLCREIGHKIDANYKIAENSTNNSTSASLYKLFEYFKESLPTNKYIVSDFIASNPDTKTVLGNGIIVMGGEGVKFNPITNEYVPAAHVWAIDGYIYKQYTVYVYTHKPNSPIETLERQFNKSELYSRVNWGWSGSHNGYFNNNPFIIKDENNYNISLKFDQKFYYFTIKTK